MQAYCVKDKKKVPLQNPTYKLNARGSPIAQGKCPNCGTTVTLMLGKDNTPADLAAKRDKFKKGAAERKSRKSRKSRKQH